MPRTKKITDVAETGHNSVDGDKLEKIVGSLLKIKEERDNLNMRQLALFNQADDAGMDRKMVREVLKERAKPTDETYKLTVNMYFEAMGMEPKYALTPLEEAA